MPIPKSSWVGTLKFDLYLALVTFLIPLGWSLSGFHPNIVLACICWLLTLGLLIHAFWITGKFAVTIKLVATFVVLAGVILLAWGPVIREYQRQHPPPSFAFVVPGVVLYGQPVSWLFLINRRGVDSLYNVEIYFRDMDRVISWKGRQYLPPEEISRSELYLSYPEVDPGYGLGFARKFQWIPFSLEHGHFWARISFRGGRVDEDLRIEKTDRGWEYKMKVFDTDTKDRIFIDCRDPWFPKETSDVATLPKCFPDVTNY